VTRREADTVPAPAAAAERSDRGAGLTWHNDPQKKERSMSQPITLTDANFDEQVL
jgi:hypothetical protein